MAENKLELTARLEKFLPIESGTGANGTWQKQTLIVCTTDDKFPKNVSLTLFGDKIIGDAERYSVGDTLTFSLNLESREYKGRWYPDIRCWKISVAPGASPAPAKAAPPAAAPPRNAMPAAPPIGFDAPDDGGDLPF